VLKLAVVWSRTPYLREVILSDRQEAKDLVHYSIELLSENIADSNKQLIIEFVWNLIQIDPDDPLLVPHGDRLLAHLTQVSSLMIDSNSSISLSVHEFDLLLPLSRQPSNTATTEQLCSIFFWLLRQNAFSKKKKSFEHAFRSTTIDHYLLPIVCSFINDVINERSQGIHDDIVFQCLTVLSGRFAVGEVQSTVHFLLSTVESNGSNADFGAEAMRLTRTISAIIDGFHFQGTDDPNNGEGQRITRAIQQRLLPMIVDRHSDQQWHGDEER
jgi:hypothetical protein